MVKILQLHPPKLVQVIIIKKSVQAEACSLNPIINYTSDFLNELLNLDLAISTAQHLPTELTVSLAIKMTFQAQLHFHMSQAGSSDAF